MTERIPRVSIGLPVYNGDKYLREAIASLLAQTYSDFELIISDNGSTDGTQAICQYFADRDERVRYHRRDDNGGAAWNFNRVVELARGEFFRWAAHDDLCAPTFLARCVELLDSEPSVVLCATRTAVIDSNGDITTLTDDGPPELHGADAAGEWQRLANLNSYQPHERFQGVLLQSLRCYEEFGLMRRATMQRTGLHRPYCGAEKVFLAEMSLLGRFAEVPEVLFFSRYHDDRFSALPSAHQQNLWVDPQRTWRFAMPRRLRCTCGYFLLIPLAPISLVERVRCLVVFARFVLQVKKWKRTVVDAVSGAAMQVDLPTTSGQLSRSR